MIHAHTYDDLKPKGGCAYNKLNNYEKTTARLQPQSYSQSRAAVATGVIAFPNALLWRR